jgi:hypothetical protein
MAITTVDQAIAGMQPAITFAKAVTGTMVAGRMHTLLYLAGNPAAYTAASNTSGSAGTVLTSLTGQIPFTHPGGTQSAYLARFQAQATQAGVLMLCDRIWHNVVPSITATTEQLFTGSQVIPARDANGGTAGVGVLAGVEVISATGANTPTLTVTYVDTDGAAGSATNQTATVASSIAGTFHEIGYAAGDTGISQCQSIKLSASWSSGTISCVLYRVIAMLELSGANIPNAIDPLTGGFPKVYANTVPFLIFRPNTTTTSNISGHVIWSNG